MRVHNLVPESEWSGRYELINAFESELVAAGTTVIKCALVVSRDEQKAQLLAEQLERPDKYWKYNPGDIDERAGSGTTTSGVSGDLRQDGQDSAPWH